MSRRPASEVEEAWNALGSEPPRLHEDVSSELGSLVRAGRSRSPSDDAVRRLGERLAASGALEAARSSAGSTRTRLARHVAYALSGVIVIGLAGWLVAWRDPSESRIVPPVATVGAVASPLSASTERPSEAQAGGGEIPSVQIDELPSSTPPSTTIASAPTARKTPTVVPAASADRAPSSPSELALVQRAARELASDPATALALAEEHARTFPAGVLEQEREVLAVEALVRLGRSKDAKARADALLARFPNTPYVLRLAHALGEPVAPAASPAKDR